MNIHEYQAKQLFAEAGVAVPNGTVAQSEQEFDQAISALPAGKPIVVKAQIHAGGRGKGTFKDGFQGGVHVVSDGAVAKEKAQAMLGNVLVTKQTGEDGKEVGTVYFTEASDIEKEYYLAVLMDRATSKPVIIASTEGGVDIDAGTQQFVDVLPALGMARAGHVGVRQFVDQDHAGLALQCGIQVELGQLAIAIRHHAHGQAREAGKLGLGLGAAMGLDHSGDHVRALRDQRLGGFQHGEGLADPGRPFDQNRFAQIAGQQQGGGDGPRGDVIDRRQTGGDGLDRSRGRGKVGGHGTSGLGR